MNSNRNGYRPARKGAMAAFVFLALALVLSMSAAAAPAQPGQPADNKPEAKAQPLDTQYFQDIAVGSFFYPFTAALYQQGVVSGYTCGTPPAGACVPPGNLPYYIPSGNVTRGQMSIYIQNARTKAGLKLDDGTIGAAQNISSTNHTPGADNLYIRSYGSANYGINVISADSYAMYARSNGAPAIRATTYYTGAAVIYASNYAPTGYGLYGEATDAGGGTGVYGEGTTYGVYGNSTDGYGVRGFSTNNDGGHFTSSADYGVYGGSVNSYGGYFNSNNNDAADFSGALWGIYTVNTGTQPSVYGYSGGAGSYAGYFNSNVYRGLFAQSPTSWYSLYVEANGSTVGAYVDGNTYVNGNLTVTGSKSGYVVDVMKNASDETLEAGDVVVIAGSSDAAVLGDIPVPMVKKANAAYSSGVVGIVDVPMYVPDAATAAAYNAQKQADREAAAYAKAHPDQKLPTSASIENRISDDMGMPHADNSSNSVAAGAYANVVTLGAYKMVKVDASFGAIKAGDLLTTSPHAGYAMKADEGKIKFGSVVGKALGDLDSGTGMITVMVTLK